MPKISLFVITVAGSVAMAAAASAADLSQFSGTWARNTKSCGGYLKGKLDEKQMRGARMMIIKAAEIEWANPASCQISNLKGSGKEWTMDGKCELKGDEFETKLTLKSLGSDKINVALASSPTGPEKSDYTRCSKKTEWLGEQ